MHTSVSMDARAAATWRVELSARLETSPDDVALADDDTALSFAEVNQSASWVARKIWKATEDRKAERIGSFSSVTQIMEEENAMSGMGAGVPTVAVASRGLGPSRADRSSSTRRRRTTTCSRSSSGCGR